MNVEGIRGPLLWDGGEQGVGAEVGRRTAEEKEVLETERHELREKVRNGGPDMSVEDYNRQLGDHPDACRFAGIEKEKGKELNRLKRSRDEHNNRHHTKHGASV